jgi:nucleotide-binding universal stress UspA family protein
MSTRDRQVSVRPSPKLIGVAVDGNPSGRDAVVLGSLFARATGAELMLIAVHEEPLIPVALPGGMSWTALEKRAQRMLAETRDALAPSARIAVQADVLVWRGLRHVARQEHRDLLVVGSSHKADVGRVRLGRSAGQLLGHLECPLSIAPSGFQQHATKRLDRIGVGFDGTPESRAALDLAVSIASTTGAALEVRSAIDDGVAGGLRTEQIVLEGNAITKRQLISAFERDLAATSGVGVPTNLEVEVGMPTDVLSELCDRVDLLVVGSGRSGPPGRVQLGKTGRGFLRLATCPVLVVPRPAAPPRHSRLSRDGT